jgi:hypothetical protein
VELATPNVNASNSALTPGAVMQDIDFYDVGGQTVFPIYGASGGLASAYIFYFVTGFQVWNESPRSGAYISNLAIPTGY